jgi:hypothetical protein
MGKYKRRKKCLFQPNSPTKKIRNFESEWSNIGMDCALHKRNKYVSRQENLSDITLFQIVLTNPRKQDHPLLQENPFNGNIQIILGRTSFNPLLE